MKEHAIQYYNINETGLWEEGNYILYRTTDPDSFAAERRLDDKSLTSWNALAISGLLKAYRATGKKKYLEMATRCARMIRDQIWIRKEVL